MSGQDQYGNTVTISASDNVAFEITADTDEVDAPRTAQVRHHAATNSDNFDDC